MSSSITDIITSIATISLSTSTSTSTSEVASSTTSHRQSGFGGPQLNPERPGQVGTMGMDRKPQSGEYGKGLPLYGQIIVFVMVGLMICGAVFGFWWFSRKWKKEAEQEQRQRQMMGSVEVRDGDKGEVEVIELPSLGRNDERV